MTSRIELEKAIIGAIILDHDKLLEVSDEVTPEDFDTDARVILEAALRLYADGKPCDLVSLIEASGPEAKVFLLDCVSTPTAANAVYHAKALKAMSLKSRIRTLGATIAHRDIGDDIEKEIAGIEAELIGIAEKIVDSRKSDTDSILTRIAMRQKKITKAMDKGESLPWIKTEFWGEQIPGYYPGHFWCIVGYTSFGKSLLLSSMLVDAMRQGAKPLIFSLEDSQEEKMMGMRGVMSDLPKAYQLKGDIRGYEDVLRDTDIQLSHWGPIIYDNVYSVEEMRLKAKKHVLRDGINLVGVDYAQQANRGSGSLYERMSHVSGYLQEMFKDLGVTGIVLSQTDNATARGDSKVIGTKGGGDLAAAADIVLNLLRDKNRKNILDIEILKNRAFGPTGNRPCRFTDRWTAIEYDYNRGVTGK
jgi:replicative DNA helicase